MSETSRTVRGIGSVPPDGGKDLEVTQAETMTMEWRGLNVRRLILAIALAPLLLGGGPIYMYAGSEQDQAKLDVLYGPPDGGHNIYGPALYSLPAGWVLAATCLILAISALPIASRRWRNIPSGPVSIAAGLLMLAAIQLTDTRAWMHHYIGVGGTIGREQVGSYSYIFEAAFVILVGVALMFRAGRK